MNELLRVLAEQAGFVTSHRRVGGIGWIWVSDGYPIDNQLERFAVLVRNDATELAKQTALDKKADNARELGLDYEPVKEWRGMDESDWNDLNPLLYGWVNDNHDNVRKIVRWVDKTLKEKNCTRQD